MSRADSARAAVGTASGSTNGTRQERRERHSSRDCECPTCDEGNGGLRFCSKCRYNGCTAGKALCGGSNDE
jgi:hypothetical protein